MVDSFEITWIVLFFFFTENDNETVINIIKMEVIMQSVKNYFHFLWFFYLPADNKTQITKNDLIDKITQTWKNGFKLP